MLQSDWLVAPNSKPTVECIPNPAEEISNYIDVFPVV